jgi:hypothetical protein
MSDIDSNTVTYMGDLGTFELMQSFVTCFTNLFES